MIRRAFVSVWVLAGLTLVGVFPASSTELNEGERCLALAMYWEAKTEGPEGMMAVGAVVLNRVEHEGFPGTVCAVVTQGGEQPPCQFSWWCDGKSDVPREVEAWRDARELARSLLANRPPDPTLGSLFFHASNIAVPWRSKRERTVRIGRHIYYR